MRIASLSAAFALLLLCAGAALAAEKAQNGKIDVLDIHKLPLGDGQINASPARTMVMSCQTEFRRGARGAAHIGNWVHGKTWDLTQKLTVQGKVMWPEAQFRITEVNDASNNKRVVSRLVEGNGLPVETPTGNFPIAQNDPAFQIDRNPNPIDEQNVVLRLPMMPEFAASPSCVPMGMIGVALNGVAIYNALDAAGRDAVAHEVQDLCSGHPQGAGEYHYHGPSPCLPQATENETLIGYALDGFGIYSIYDAQGRELTNADLDECHGHTSEVE